MLVCLILVGLAPAIAGFFAHPLHDDKTGDGIIDFELAGSVHRANEILGTWRREGVIDDAKSIQTFDLVYPLLYAAALAGACLAAGGAWRRRGNEALYRLGILMAYVACAAAAFDYVENVGLGISLWRHPASPWPQLSFAAAFGKFAAIWTSLIFALTGLMAFALNARQASRAKY